MGKELISTVFLLLMVAGILFLTWWVTKGYASVTNRGRQSRYIKVIDRAAITQNCQIVLLNIGGRIYAAGVSAGSVSLLGELDEDSLTPLESSQGTSLGDLDFKGLLGRLERKERKEHGE